MMTSEKKTTESDVRKRRVLCCVETEVRPLGGSGDFDKRGEPVKCIVGGLLVPQYHSSYNSSDT
eukprot:3756600-Rhodomonas_salina.3